MKDMFSALKAGSGFTVLLILVGAIFFYNNGIAEAVDAKNNFITSFGSGNVTVRLYADYFCGPCGALEPKAEQLVRSLVKKNVINITFIDAPFHKFSSLYARYFLFILNEKKDFAHALSVRPILFDGAGKNLTEAEKIEEYLKKKGIKFKPFDARPVFIVFEGYLREDKIDSTPTCVIERNGKKEVFKGGDNILKALESLDN